MQTVCVAIQICRLAGLRHVQQLAGRLRDNVMHCPCAISARQATKGGASPGKVQLSLGIHRVNIDTRAAPETCA